MSPTLDILWRDAITNCRLTISKETQARADSYEEKIKDAFGLKFLDDYTAINDALLWEYLGKAYEQGFLTAFHLWMDAFSAYPLE